jgi:hypothetical protein
MQPLEPRSCLLAGRGSRPLAFALALACTALAARAGAQDTTVFLDIERLTWGGCSDGFFGGPPEIYWVVTIDGNEESSRATAIESNFSPVTISPRTFSQEVDISQGSVELRIVQKDRDGGIFNDDDTCDISPVGNDLNLTLDLVTCTFTGDVSGNCDESVFGSNSFEFRIRVDAPPPSAAGTNVRCLHDPIWAQPGEAVTITAEALDGALDPKTAATIELWIDQTGGPTDTFAGEMVGSATFTPTGDSFFYGCRVIDGSDTVFSGWRTSEVGRPIDDDVVAVLYTGPSPHRLDFVLFADVDDYTSSGNPPIFGDDPAFIGDVSDVIAQGYFDDGFYLGVQDELNFWIGLEGGDADGFSSPPPACNLVAPSAPIADTRAVLHLDDLRDCATMNMFSVEAPRVGTLRDPLLTLLHETGHRPFGLADEYCCDGGYFQLPTAPNLFTALPACQSDAPDLGATAADCRNFTADPSRGGAVWHLSDPTGDDLMEGSGEQTPQPADLRRMNWMLDQCRAGDC